MSSYQQSKTIQSTSNVQLDAIKRLRAENYSYASIARFLGLSANTVKSLCRRYGFLVDSSQQAETRKAVPYETLLACKYCGKLIDNLWHRQKLFCSDQCRYAYWNREKRIVRSSPKRPQNLSKRGMDI